MKSRSLRSTSTWAVCLVACIASGCGITGSETNWLGGGDDAPVWFGQCGSGSDCSGGSECVCGVCTTRCSESSTCLGNMTCSTNAPAAYAAQCGAPATDDQGICQPACVADNDCKENQGCINGLCAWLGDLNAPTVSSEFPPPPISGGTMTVLAGGHAVAVADPDRDQVAIVDLNQMVLRALVPLLPGDEPGRLVEDAQGFVHVALRRGGAVATIDPLNNRVIRRRAVCQYPRGLVFDAKSTSLIVACAGGELVTLPAGAGEVTRKLKLDDDLRDVVIDGDHLLVSRFRSAEILVVGSDGALQNRFSLPRFTEPPESATPSRAPAVAWRMVGAPDGGAYVSLQYQRADGERPVPTAPVGAYAGDGRLDACGQNVGTAVRSAVARVDATGKVWVYMTPGVLPVDLAIMPSKPHPYNTVASAYAGSRIVPGLPTRPAVSTFWDYPDPSAPPSTATSPCVVPTPGKDLPGQVVALAFDLDGELVRQTRDPWQVSYAGRSVELPGAVRKDTGHDLFHTATRGGIACASCHPEGHDDGFVWSFDVGPRRTQSLAGGISGTAPFHWEGDMSSIDKLLGDVFTKRMSGFKLKPEQAQAVLHFIDSIPNWAPREALDAATLERGRALFDDPNMGCASCHAGASLTDNRTLDVGTGGRFQVPSLLGVSRRAPFFHDGSVPTLAARFTVGVTNDKHGHISSLSTNQTADLVEYLNTL